MMVPHITDSIQEWIESVAKVPVDGKEGSPDVCVIELGGTIGPGNFRLVHVSFVPVVVGEHKREPTQHSVRELRRLGLTPNILACRSTKEENIVTLYDVPNIWHVPLLLRDQKVHGAILKELNLIGFVSELVFQFFLASMCKSCFTLGSTLQQLFMSSNWKQILKFFLQALLHATVACHKKLVLEWVAASDLEEITSHETPDVHKAAWDLLKGANGILVPGGFGDTRVEGKILATKYAREKEVPFLGIYLGMQLAVVEFARSVLGHKDANNTEFEPETSTPCVIYMPEESTTHMRGTMRLGSRRTHIQVPDCKSAKLYGNAEYVDERHRHKYEVNPDMIAEFEHHIRSVL
ncbi:unnamed protein product [Eruca vesicaria subsp. sativa]|uniref:CTP synthase n=1 Tax=Eruca vesicaria subsp. sativa TaxID=29727 RepID=A0ABC8K5X9_ERUVS|nr:unnamed protein product [Eruca vesicaria subsp. sativa]